MTEDINQDASNLPGSVFRFHLFILFCLFWNVEMTLDTLSNPFSNEEVQISLA
jgi:hypothetical protein